MYLIISMTTIIQFLLRSYKVLWIQLFLTQGSQSYRAIWLVFTQNIRIHPEKVKAKESLYKPLQTLKVPGASGSQISKESTNESGKVVSLTHRPPLPTRKYSWYSFLLQAESTPGLLWGRKDYVNEKFQWQHQESNPRPCSALPQPTAPSRASWSLFSDIT